MSRPDSRQAARLRRIVTGHDAAGQSIIVEDAELDAVSLAENPDRSDVHFFHVWATHEMPVSLSDASLPLQREGSATTILGTGAGSVLRVGVLAPGARSPMHRTESLDYGILLEGECDLELDGGEVRTLRAGDAIIQRGTNHVWHNRSDAPCRFVWVLLDAQPHVVGGRPLGTSRRHSDDPETSQGD
jgi:quercetin dioxygenase-like cupin family protein